MNERIKQLWEDNDTIEVCYPEQGSPVSVSATTLEKFAELIVRETLDQVAEFNRLTKAYQEQGIDPEIDVAKEVLKNFGVKE